MLYDTHQQHRGHGQHHEATHRRTRALAREGANGCERDRSRGGPGRRCMKKNTGQSDLAPHVRRMMLTCTFVSRAHELLLPLAASHLREMCFLQRQQYLHPTPRPQNQLFTVRLRLRVCACVSELLAKVGRRLTAAVIAR